MQAEAWDKLKSASRCTVGLLIMNPVVIEYQIKTYKWQFLFQLYILAMVFKPCSFNKKTRGNKQNLFEDLWNCALNEHKWKLAKIKITLGLWTTACRLCFMQVVLPRKKNKQRKTTKHTRIRTDTALWLTTTFIQPNATPYSGMHLAERKINENKTTDTGDYKTLCTAARARVVSQG